MADKQIDKYTERQADKMIKSLTRRQGNRMIKRETNRKKDRQNDLQRQLVKIIDMQIGRPHKQRDRWKVRQIDRGIYTVDRQTDKQTDRVIYRQTER